ncbi:ABC transporter substrate-binding protein [Vibrio mediterranei]
MIKLRGMTWDHDRGYNPLVAVSDQFKQLHPNVEIEWHKRSLQAFADRPLDVIAEEYDFMIIDHPHIGEASKQGCIIPLNDEQYSASLTELAQNSVGPSQPSYELDGKQWALAVDAACQVGCYRPDLITEPPKTWRDVLALAKEGKVLWPLKPVDAVDSFFTLCANLGSPVAETTEQFVDPQVATQALTIMREICQYLPADNLSHNPIDTLEHMSTSDDYAYSPLLFGYTNYSRQGYRQHLIQFCDMPSANSKDIMGSIIGGTGIAISAKCQHQEIAKQFAYYLASAEVQSSVYFEADGQPAHKQAWLNADTNRLASDFFTSTLATIENSWLRPRYNGFLYVADVGGDLVNAFLGGEIPVEKVLTDLEQAYQQSLSENKSRKYE